MSHTVHPFIHRLITLRDWKSRWFAQGKKYREFLRADTLIREYLEESLRGKYVADIEMERSAKGMRIVIHSSRPGVIIGRSGEGAQQLRAKLLQFMKKHALEVPPEFKIDVVDVPNPDANAAIVVAGIMEALEKRMPFRRILKQTVDKVLAVRGVKGVRIALAGRLGGAEMARYEDLKKGSIPLQFIRGDLDYARGTARLSYGGIGVKVWIYKGDSLETKDR